MQITTIPSNETFFIPNVLQKNMQRSKYVIYGVLVSISISAIVLYVYPTSDGGIYDSPEINEQAQITIPATTSPTIADDSRSSVSGDYYVDSDGSKHYTLSAADSPVIKR